MKGYEEQSVTGFAIAAASSWLNRSHQSVSTQAFTVSLCILLCTLNDACHAIQMSLLHQISAVTSGNSSFMFKRTRSFTQQLVSSCCGAAAWRHLCIGQNNQRIVHANAQHIRHTCMTLTASSTVKPSTTFINTLTTYSRLHTHETLSTWTVIENHHPNACKLAC